MGGLQSVWVWILSATHVFTVWFWQSYSVSLNLSYLVSLNQFLQRIIMRADGKLSIHVSLLLLKIAMQKLKITFNSFLIYQIKATHLGLEFSIYFLGSIYFFRLLFYYFPSHSQFDFPASIPLFLLFPLHKITFRATFKDSSLPSFKVSSMIPSLKSLSLSFSFHLH